MATKYKITINMSQDTVDALSNGDFSLYGFKGVKTTMKGGAPLVWFASKDFSLSTTVEWEEQYQAYTSQNAIIPQGRITASANYDIDLGRTLDVTGAQGTGGVRTGGTQNAISIVNHTGKPFTCGISQKQGGTGKPTPLCAFPLYGTGMDVFAPIELVMLEFATAAVNTGTVIEQSFSQACLIDLTTEPDLELSFDINAGWDADGCPNVHFYPPGTNLAPLLLQASSSLSRRARAANVVLAQPAAPSPRPHELGNNGALISA